MANSKVKRPKNGQPLVLEDVRIIFRNFSGAEGQYNAKGDRNFGVVLDPDLAENMTNDGWAVKQLKPREEEDAPQDWIKVKIGFNNKPPRIVMVTDRGRTTLTESELSILDWADIAKVDLIINPYDWDIADKAGRTAYLGSIFVTINEDELERKYADIPDTAQSSISSRATVEFED